MEFGCFGDSATVALMLKFILLHASVFYRFSLRGIFKNWTPNHKYCTGRTKIFVAPIAQIQNLQLFSINKLKLIALSPHPNMGEYFRYHMGVTYQ